MRKVAFENGHFFFPAGGPPFVESYEEEEELTGNRAKTNRQTNHLIDTR